MEKKKLSIKEIGMDKLIIMLLCGVFLLILSLPRESSRTTEKTEGSLKTGEEVVYEIGEADSTEEYVEHTEKRMEEILKKVDGIGDVKVMITVKTSREKVTLKDSPYSEETTKESDSAGGTRESRNTKTQEETVLVEGGGNASVPYILKEIEPEIEGVLVLAENGDQSPLKTEIVEAVQVLFDVPPHKIKVMKMQEN